MRRRSRLFGERFWDKVIILDSDDCWEWTGAKDRQGYGVTTMDQHYERAPRAAWILTHGTIPGSMCICHTCDNPSCVNPRHLFLGTRGDNNRDRAKKGRSACGENNGKAKLTKKQVNDIRRQLSKCGQRQVDVAQKFGVARQVIWRIAHGYTWQHLLAEKGISPQESPQAHGDAP